MHYILFYDFVDNMLERRVPHREAHLNYLQQAEDKGVLVLAGAFTNPVDGSALVFNASTKEEVEEFAKKDPYVLNGLITNWRVREWTVVVGTALKP